MVKQSGISGWQEAIVVLALCSPGLVSAADVAETDRRKSERSNTRPVIEGTPPATATAGHAYAFRPTAVDADGDRLRFWIRNAPSWAKFDWRTGELRGVPTQPGTTSGITIGVTDWRDSVALPAFTIQVGVGAPRADLPPEISGSPDLAVVSGNSYGFQPRASDPEGARLSFAVDNRPAWASFDASNGRLWGTPTDANVGVHGNIVISVTDGASFSSLAPFAIEVSADPNEAPVIAGAPPTQVMAGQLYSFTPAASDADGDRLTFSASNKPAWASFDPASGRLSGTPSSAQVGSTSGIVISVSDGEASAALPAFGVEVTDEPNRAPTITGSPSSGATEGQTYSFTPAATDPDGDVIVFSIQNRPAWATFSSSSGRLSGTPGSTHVGNYTGIVISVSDGAASAALPSFSITVADAPNRAPVLSGTPPTSAVAGEPYVFTPAASDPDGDRLTFSISGKPAWASFDPATGLVSGTPADAGYYPSIVISASDGEMTTSLPGFNIRVDEPVNTSVTLSWQAPTQNMDGTPLTDLSGYEVHYGLAPDDYSQILSLPDAALTTVTIEDLAPATWYFAVRALNSTGTRSDFSNVASKTID